MLIEMNTPGVVVEPIITMADDHETNQVFFENVRVPKSNRIGEENKGWTYAKYLLEFERGGGFSANRIRREVEELHALKKELERTNPAFNTGGEVDKKIARIEIDLKSLQITELRILSALSDGGNPGAESSILKLTTTRLEQAVNELAMEIIGYQALAMDIP